MDDRIQHARKPESADSEDLDDQTFMDILDSGTFPRLDPSISDDRDTMDDKDRIEMTGTFVRDSELKRKASTLRTIAQSERETVDPETLQGTSRIKIRPSVKTSLTRVQRALRRFKSG